MIINTESVPKLLWQSVIIISAMLIFGIKEGIQYERITSLIMMFCIYLFFFKLIIASLHWGSESFSDLLLPVKILILTFITQVAIQTFINPAYTIRSGETQLQMAKECQDAEWELVIHYTPKDKEDFPETHTMIIKGDSSYINSNAERISKGFIKECRPNATYDYNTFTLLNLPKDFVLKNRLPHDYYEAKEHRDLERQEENRKFIEQHKN